MPKTARLEIRLTDAPTESVREVWVDIKDIQINTGDTAAWTSVPNIHQGIYNLMDLTNGRDTLLADADIPAGRLNQLRLILGDNNYIITNDGQKEMLNTPSAQESGLKLLVQTDLTGGMLYRLVLDFDAAKSIVTAGNSGNYILKPVIRVLSFAPSGGIVIGFVAPDTIHTSVFAIMGTDTISSTSTFDGNYQFKDIKAGSYALSFYPDTDSFHTATKNIEVTLGQTTIVDTVQLEHK
ncbi:DUF4382 domain-containing protein [Flavihumibacter fluvii]|uniref:DUF4382 domain-containing protein n=1 Tax=Flavihumibacter fluvii TaxID=2838157 RepID=UPI001BDE69D5|nr:DUF4382 domain-containing protein [Flavihumibacter fluvii]ULQ53103.1 DUF4382 domain-containing protein [Flavihumibacter fluvii]